MSESGSSGKGVIPGAARPVEVGRYPIRLDQFLKLSAGVATGGEAKTLIVDGQVEVDGEVERRRGRQLRGGEIVSVARGGAYLAAKTP